MQQSALREEVATVLPEMIALRQSRRSRTDLLSLARRQRIPSPLDQRDQPVADCGPVSTAHLIPPTCSHYHDRTFRPA